MSTSRIPRLPRARSSKKAKSYRTAPATCLVSLTDDRTPALAALMRIVASFIALCPAVTEAAPAAALARPWAMGHDISCVAPPLDWAKIPKCVEGEPVVPENADKELSQYYTREDVAAHCYSVFLKYFDPSTLLLVEPSAGTGSFFKLFPPGSLAYDVDPKYPGTQKKNFLSSVISSNRHVAVVGNPPFGTNCNQAIAFFNHAARQPDVEVIAFILPRTFRKATILKRLNEFFYLLHDEEMPENAFIFQSKPHNVSTIFQIWVRCATPRALPKEVLDHDDFEFVKVKEANDKKKADFVIRRNGAKAGEVHYNFAADPDDNYFICGRAKSGREVEAIMTKLDLAGAASNAAGPRSLAKTEIVHLFDEWIRAQAFAPRSI